MLTHMHTRCVISNPPQSIVRLPAKSHKGDITAGAVSYSLSLIATGSSDDVGGGKFKGSVRVWDFETGKMEGMLEQEDEVDILALKFAHPYPVIFVTDSQGWVQMWGVRMSAYKYSLMYRFRNQKLPCSTSTVSGMSKRHRPVPSPPNQRQSNSHEGVRLSITRCKGPPR